MADTGGARQRSAARKARDTTREGVEDSRPNVSPKGWSKTARFSAFCAAVCVPVIALFVAVEMELRERISIMINAGMSILGFIAVRWGIPIAIPYMLKRNMFGMDINKRGSPGGEIKM